MDWRLVKPGVVGVFAVAVGLGPLVLDSFRASQFAYVAVFLIAIAGLNILTGYTGQISLGHGAFMAIGGYTTAILTHDHGVHELWTIPLAGLVAGAAGLAFGVPALRLSGLYLALATFGVAVATPAVLKWDKVDQWTGGSVGKNLPLHTNDWLYYTDWIAAVALLALAWLLLRGKIGRAFRAVRDSEVAAASSGISLAVYKTVAFGISAFYAGVAGSLFAITAAYVSPDTYPIDLSLFIVVGAVTAGLGSLWGLVFGAALIEFLRTGDIEHWLHVPSSVPADVFFGAVLIAVMIALPGGAAGLLARLGLLRR
jgi:branched-chain amino acid transport system permease protein